jgi:hypothetical protein
MSRSRRLTRTWAPSWVNGPSHKRSQLQLSTKEVVLTKYFKAQVELSQTVTVEVAADNESEGKARAREAALLKVPNTRAGDVQLEFIGESDLRIGMRMVHSLFGPGEVLELTRSTGPGGGFDFTIKIKFDRGDTKDIHGPSGFLQPESFGS